LVVCVGRKPLGELLEFSEFTIWSVREVTSWEAFWFRSATRQSFTIINRFTIKILTNVFLCCGSLANTGRSSLDGVLQLKR
jgi:hypothetical protein